MYDGNVRYISKGSRYISTGSIPKLEELIDRMDSIDEDWDNIEDIPINISPSEDVKLRGPLR